MGRRCIVDFNDLIAQYTIKLLNLENSRFTSSLILLIQDFLIKKSSAVVAPTNFIKEYALALGRKDKRATIINATTDNPMCKRILIPDSSVFEVLSFFAPGVVFCDVTAG